MAASEKHYFVINQMGTSADRRGGFVSAQAARDWATKHYPYPCWILPVEYIGAMEFKPLDSEGNRVDKG